MYDSAQDTKEHINLVKKFMQSIAIYINNRGFAHDDSKLLEPEKSIFDEYTPKLSQCEYGSEEYNTCLKGMEVALDHHYANNKHHPEFHPDGIQGMDLLDLIELVCDWKASTLRNKNGNILKSIEMNQKRFGYSDELKQILINTVKEYFE